MAGWEKKEKLGWSAWPREGLSKEPGFKVALKDMQRGVQADVDDSSCLIFHKERDGREKLNYAKKIEHRKPPLYY